MPIHVTCDLCRSEFVLKDEFGGRRVRCQSCQHVIQVPEAAYTPARERVERGYHRGFDRDRFFVNQKRLSIGEKYYVYDENQQPVLFIERPAHFWRQILGAFGAIAVLIACGLVTAFVAIGLDQQFRGSPAGGIAAVIGMILTIVATIAAAIVLSPKRHITIYGDDQRRERLLEILQDRKFNVIRATYTVVEPGGGELGRFMKNYLYNIFRKRWYLFDPQGSIRVLAKEDSMILSLLRRLLGTFFGLLRTNFVILRPESDRVIGEFNRKFTLFDRYVLDMTHDPDHELDRRLAVALAVLLDTGEQR
jgi:predicted Zn finger-like uncharacterized protein